jgi:predicted DCC family thiol-disulfide oxidoreductase YuxK
LIQFMSETPVVLFDGTCGFCQYWVNCLAERLDLPGELRAWQSVDLAEFQLTEAQVREKLWYLPAPGDRSGGSAAFAAWFAGGNRVARVSALVLRAPLVRSVAEACYREIARNRHRIPGPWGHSCEI